MDSELRQRGSPEWWVRLGSGTRSASCSARQDPTGEASTCKGQKTFIYLYYFTNTVKAEITTTCLEEQHDFGV